MSWSCETTYELIFCRPSRGPHWLLTTGSMLCDTCTVKAAKNFCESCDAFLCAECGHPSDHTLTMIAGGDSESEEETSTLFRNSDSDDSGEGIKLGAGFDEQDKEVFSFAQQVTHLNSLSTA